MATLRFYRVEPTPSHSFCNRAFMEGPSLVILKEEAQPFVGKEIIAAGGALNWNKDVLVGQKVKELRTWGKHFLILLNDCTIRIHYLMFGNYYINSRHPEKIPKLTLEFENGEWNNYNCAARILEEPDVDKIYDWSTDVMNDNWSPANAKKKLAAQPQMLVCDALMDQSIFTGVGNIIKNEVLYRVQLHPESQVGALPAAKTKALLNEARNYCFDFFEWKKEGTLRKHWLAHTKKECTRCHLPLTKQHTGLNPRRSFFCTNCQELYVAT